MDIASIKHKGLLRFAERGDKRGVPQQFEKQLARMLKALDLLKDVSDIVALPMWKPHLLKGDRKGVWSMHVSANLRMTFEVIDGEIYNLDLEDYHGD